MAQMPLNFGVELDYSDDNFLVSYSNKIAFDWVDRWPNWTTHNFAIYGPEKCGKTHLAHIWQRKTGAIFLNPEKLDIALLGDQKCCIIEDVGLVKDEDALFHLYNHIVGLDGYMMFTDHEPFPHLDFTLPDLVSRMNAVTAFEVFEPDDILLRTVLMKGFSDHQLRVGLDVIEFLLLRMERSFLAVNKLVNDIDQMSLIEKRNITIPFVKKVLEKNNPSLDC